MNSLAGTHGMQRSMMSSRKLLVLLENYLNR